MRCKNWLFYEDSVLKNFEKPISRIFETSKGHLFIGTRGAGFFYYDGKFLTKIKGSKYDNTNVADFFELSENEFLAATEGKGIVKIIDGKIIEIPHAKDSLYSEKVLKIHKDDKGIIWVGTNEGLNIFENNVIRRSEVAKGIVCMDLANDRENNLWIASNKGIYKYSNENKFTDYIGEKEGLPYQDIPKILHDAEGSLWACTYKAGLIRLREGKFTVFSYREGLSSKVANGIFEDDKRNIFIATDGENLNCLQEGEVKNFPLKTPLKDKLRSFIKDKSGNLWLCTYSGIVKVAPDGKEFFYGKENGLPDLQARCVFEDSRGNIWFGFRTGGLLIFLSDGSVKTLNRGNSGLLSDFIMDIKEDKKGNILVGTNTAGFALIDQNFTVKSFGIRDGLSSDLVFKISTDEENRYWAATDAGISFVENEKIYTAGTKNGLPVESCYGVLPDKFGNIWIPSNKGILCVNKNSLIKAAKNNQKIDGFVLYGKSDGLKDEECNATGQNCIDSEGKIWICTFDGVVCVNPNSLTVNQNPPKIIIEYIYLDEQKILLGENLQKIEIPAGTRRIVIGFTAMRLIAPKKVNFNFQLKGFENQAIETSELREAIYTNLSPGKYTFHLTACNNDKVWNTEGVNLDIIQKPHFYQTTLFYVFLFVFISAALYFAYRVRVRSIQESRKKLEKIVELRTAEINLQKEELLAQRDRIDEQKKELERSYKKIQAVSEVGQKVTAELNFDSLVEKLYTHINTLMKAEIFGIGTYNANAERLEFRSFMTEGEKISPFYDYLTENNKLSVRCHAEKELILHNDYRENENAVLGNALGKKPKSVIFLPLIIENQVLGVITAQSFHLFAYKEYHVTSFQALASYVAIALANSRSYEIIQTKNQNITDSIRYAMTIQQVILPTEEYMNQHFKDFFVIGKPKDIVSGDFYWSCAIGGNVHIAVTDCTGHGVPGAFMSLIGHMLLNEIVNVQFIHSPCKILEEADKLLRNILNAKGERSSDGMDMLICFFEPTEVENETLLTFSGAKRPLYYVENNYLNELKGSRRSINGEAARHIPFENEQILLNSGAAVYLTTDGFADQSDEKRNRFGSQNLKNIFEKNSHLLMSEQKEILLENLKNHQKNSEQRDDITIVGLRM